jgi:hypothetical protein
MGWILRKSFRLSPGVRLNLSKSGPRLSVGVPGARASIDLEGKTRIYGGMGPIRYQKSATIGAGQNLESETGGLLGFIRRVLGR